jgi:hypothetical protein
MPKTESLFERRYKARNILVERIATLSLQFTLTNVRRSDLNATVMAGSTRVVDHTTFSELQWKRDPFSPDFFTLPPGFQAHIHVLSKEFIEILQDIAALQCIRDSALFGKEDVISMAHIDNHQASIQSRLVGLSNFSPISDCCQIAAYLCSTMLRCKIWRTSTIPVRKPSYRRDIAHLTLSGLSHTFPCNYFTSSKPQAMM